MAILSGVLASKQANLMRLIMVESRRNKELTAKMSNTKAKLKKIRLKLKTKARKELLNSRNANEVATLRRRRSQLEIVTKKEKKKVDDLRIYSMTLETNFERVKKEYLQYEKLREEALEKAKETNHDIKQSKKDQDHYIHKHERELENIDREIKHLKEFTERKNAENQLAQEEEMQKVVKTALEQSSHNPKALKNPSHNLFSQTMKGIGKLFGRRASSASLSSSFGQPGLHANGLPPRKKYPPVEPAKILNAFIKVTRSKITAFEKHDVDDLRGKKNWEAIRLSPKFVETFIQGITAFEDKIVDLIKVIQIFKEEIEVESRNRKVALITLRDYKKEHDAKLSGAKQKIEALEKLSNSLQKQLQTQVEKRRKEENHVNDLSELVLKVLKDLAQSKHLQAKAKLEQEKKKPGRKMQMTPQQAEEHAIWDAIEVRKANNDPPVLKETVRGMEILEAHVYDLLDIVANTRPDLLKDPSMVYNGYYNSAFISGTDKANDSHLSLNIDSSSDKRRSSYFGPPSPYQKNRNLSVHKTKHDIKSSYHHSEEKEGEPVSNLGVLSTDQLRQYMMMGNTI
eukprot:g9520.t1